MTTPQHLPTRLAVRGIRVAIRLARTATDTLERRTQPVDTDTPPRAVGRVDAGLTLSVVDDPDGRMRLVGARGPIDALNVTTLLEVLEEFGDGLGLHLDLSDAVLAGAVAIRRIESMVDQLERQGVHVRIVGVDPEHPALHPPIRP
jgi:hypothetical protein